MVGLVVFSKVTCHLSEVVLNRTTGLVLEENPCSEISLLAFLE